MTYNEKDGVHYMTSAEFAADTTVKATPTAKAYVYETGVLYITDGTTWRIFGTATTA
jgi:hypothetical protein